jgi:hypothetical protein
VGLISIELSSRDATLFREYMEKKDFFDALIEADVHRQYGKTIMLDIDLAGTLRAIRYETKIDLQKSKKVL